MKIWNNYQIIIFQTSIHLKIYSVFQFDIDIVIKGFIIIWNVSFQKFGTRIYSMASRER